MRNNVTFSLKTADPEDILTAMKTIPVNEAHTCDLLKGTWISPSTYIEWAQKNLESNDDCGFSSALCHSKRAVCRIIDGLLFGNHLRYVQEYVRTYPEKIQLLNDIGIKIPDIVYDLIIDPRNKLEHDYITPNHQKAEHSVELAQIFLNAMRTELQNRRPVIALGWNIQFSHQASQNQETKIIFNGFTDQLMLFVDVFEKPEQIKIVDPKDEEIRCAKLGSFDKSQTLRLAKRLRSHYTERHKSQSTHFSGRDFYQQIKKKAGF